MKWTKNDRGDFEFGIPEDFDEHFTVLKGPEGEQVDVTAEVFTNANQTTQTLVMEYAHRLLAEKREAEKAEKKNAKSNIELD